MYSKAGDPVHAVETFRNVLKADGIDKYLEELNGQPSAYEALQGR